MRNLFTIVILFFAFSVVAQEKASFTEKGKTKEIGVQFSDLDQFGLSLKKGKGKHFWRFGVLSLNSSKSTVIVRNEDVNTGDIEDKSKGLGFKFGFERRKKVTEDFETYWGLDLLYSYTKITDGLNEEGDTNRFRNISKGVGFVLGVNYHINSRFMVSAEIEPTYTSSRVKQKEDRYGGDYRTINKEKGFNFDNRTASLTFSYSF
ncbi:MAG: hypothetical protein ACEPOZ_00930 [Marinifilaceae bacterium]